MVTEARRHFWIENLPIIPYHNDDSTLTRGSTKSRIYWQSVHGGMQIDDNSSALPSACSTSETHPYTAPVYVDTLGLCPAYCLSPGRHCGLIYRTWSPTAGHCGQALDAE